MQDPAECCKAKTVPLRSVGLKPIDLFMPAHELNCPCQMCSHYEAKKIYEILEDRTETVNNKIKARMETKEKNHPSISSNYKWILKHLIVPHNKIVTRGINLYASEVVFYRDGEASDMFCCREVEDPIIKRAHRDKITSNFIQKFFSDRRRKYREIIQTFLGKKKVVVQKKPLFGRKKPPKKETKDAALIRYLDGYEQLATENQLMSLLSRRKLDPIWKEIAYIKNFITVEDPTERIFVIKYEESDARYEELQQRSKRLMRVYAQNILEGDKDYISDEQEQKFCKGVLKQSLQVYAEYLTYKIVAFIELFYDQKITKISLKILVNEMGNCYIEDVFKLEKEALTKYDWTDEIYIKKMNEHEKKIIYSKKIQPNQQIEKNSEKIGSVLLNQYEKMKDYYGLSNEEEDDQEEIANNQFFKKIHPDIQSPISDLLREPGMTVNKFKRCHLGYKPTRKPIVRPFTCNMIHSLHKITPQLRGAAPHEFVSVPKRSVSTAFSSSSGSRNRPYSQGKHTGMSFSTPRSHW